MSCRTISPHSFVAWLPVPITVAHLLLAGAASASVPTRDVDEVFSNANGTVQDAELFEANGTPGETGVGNGSVDASPASSRVPTVSFLAVAVLVVLLIAVGAAAFVRRGREHERWWDVG